MIDKERMKSICSSLIDFIINNGSRTEKIYMHEKKKYSANILKKELSIKEKKRKYGL